jgi:pantothenate kinase-related protein Tda10
MASDDQSISQSKPIVIGIAGPTRAGKTSLATALKHHFQALEFLTVETYCGSGWCATELEKAEMDKMLQTECFVQVDGKELPNLV